jgi:hypothetical protein
MHLRRAVLLMGLILVTVAIVGALVPVPRERSARQAPTPSPSPSEAAPVRTLSLRYPPPERAPRLRVDAGAHVVLQVAASEPGEAIVDALGLVGAAEPETPARFDLLASRPGRFTVAFRPAEGGTARTVGTLTVAGTER